MLALPMINKDRVAMTESNPYLAALEQAHPVRCHERAYEVARAILTPSWPDGDDEFNAAVDQYERRHGNLKSDPDRWRGAPLGRPA